MTSLCIIADTHKKHRRVAIPKCDILIHCGDFCSFQDEDLKTLEDVDAWFAESPAANIVCTGGNHDYPLNDRKFRFRFAHADCLQDRLAEINGVTIYGSPWCPDLPGFAFYASEEELIEHWRRIPSGIDILLTHTPPHGILDLPTSRNEHLGCPHLRAELARIRPRLHVFGHVHASHGTYSDGVTTFINAAIVGGPDYEVRHVATQFSLPPRANAV